MKNNDVLLIGGAAVVIFLLMNKTSSAVSPATTATTSTDPPANPDLSGKIVNNYSNPGYYNNVLYPAMLKANPNVGNPSYNLTDAECQQILTNYLDLRQGLQQRVNSSHNINDVVRDWWHTNGVPEKRTFMPLNPPSAVPYTGPIPNPNSSGSGGIWSTVIKTAGGVALALLGDGNADSVQLNNEACEVLINGSAIGLPMLDLFENATDGLASEIRRKNMYLLNKYTKGL